LCCSIFSFLWVFSWIICCGFVRFLLTIVVSVFHRFMASDNHFGIFKPFLHTLFVYSYNFMYQNAISLSPETDTILSVTFIQYHFNYYFSSWYWCASLTLRYKIQILLNKTVRFIKNWWIQSNIHQPRLSPVGVWNMKKEHININKCPLHIFKRTLLM